MYSQTSSGLTSRRKVNGFIKYSLLPSLSTLDIFYTKVFSLEKASNQQSLVSNKLLDDLLQLCQLETSNIAILGTEVCSAKRHRLTLNSMLHLGKFSKYRQLSQNAGVRKPN